MVFNAKELDEETGLYYYGARYYDPRTSIWLSADPLAEKYPNKTPYHYCSNNPVNLVDPDGKDDYLNTKGKKVYNDGEGDGIRLIDDAVLKQQKKEVDNQMKGMKFESKDAKNNYKQQQLRLRLRNGTTDNNPNSRVIRILDNEVAGTPAGSNTLDYIYSLTNDRSRNPGGKKEYYANIWLDTQEATIGFVNLGFMNRNSGSIKISMGEGRYVALANIHGHPDQLENRADGVFHTSSGESAMDRNAANSMNGVVYNIDRGNVYYYTPYSNSDRPTQYTGPRDVRSIIRYTIDNK
jgi:RHS repeat-associated protein